MIVLQPTYFSSVYQFQQLVNAKNIVFEVCDNFQKQTYRTRCYISTSNGLLALNIPIKHTGKRQKTREVKIENSFPWQRDHLRSLQNAYRSSSYFEFYEDDLLPLYKNKHTYLLDFLFLTQEWSFEMLQIDVNYSKTTSYQEDYPKEEDGRRLAIAKSKQEYPVKPYVQVFTSKHGFIPNLSILDLLFNEGPNALNLLKKQE